MKKQVSAGIVVYYKPSETVEYLLLHYIPGHWDFPKGKLEAGETKIQAAMRELEEETGLTEISIHEGFEQALTYYFKDRFGNDIEKTVHFFVGQVPNREKLITLSKEHQGYVWLPFDAALAQLTFGNAKEVLKKADAFIKS
jgi:bis(5'-nucleosidyl)-tetraphosphatase